MRRLLAALAPARGSLVTFTVLAVAVAIGLVRVVDALVLYFLQTPGYTPLGPALDVVASLVTMAGQGEITAVVALALAAVWARREGARGLVPLLLFLGVLVEFALKRVVAQTPPAADLVRTIHFLPFVEGSAPFSFPSGHATRAFFLAALLGDALPRWRPWLLALAGAVAITRVYLGAHWPSDVVGGLFLGLALAAIADSLRRR